MGLMTLFAIQVKEGAQTSIYLCASPQVAATTGKYFEKGKPKQSSAASYDQTAQKRLWEISEQLTGISTPAAV
jgi:hypothetical protein